MLRGVVTDDQRRPNIITSATRRLLMCRPLVSPTPVDSRFGSVRPERFPFCANPVIAEPQPKSGLAFGHVAADAAVAGVHGTARGGNSRGRFPGRMTRLASRLIT